MWEASATKSSKEEETQINILRNVSFIANLRISDVQVVYIRMLRNKDDSIIKTADNLCIR